jgi:hypothetical protein
MVAALTATPDTDGGFITVSLSGAATATNHTISRIDVAGNIAVVRNGDPALTGGGGTWSGQDYEAPLDAAVTYRASVGSTVVATSSAATLSSAGAPWLGHPGKPTLNFRPLVREFRHGAMAARAVVHSVISRRLPVGQSLRRASYAGELELRISGANELTALETILDDGHVLLYRAPATWIGHGTRYLQIADVGLANLTRAATDGRFNVTLPWTEVDRPAGLAQAGLGFAWSDVMTAYATWNAARAANPTWADVINGVP